MKVNQNVSMNGLKGKIMFCLKYIQRSFLKIRFIFNEDHLLVGGPFRKKIPYYSIIRVSPTTDKWTGYQISSSDKGIELFLGSETCCSIKILPKDKMAFFAGLKKRSPEALIAQSQEFL